MSENPSTPTRDLLALPDGWESVPLSKLVDEDRGIRYGIVQPGSPTSDGVPIIRVNNIREGRINDADVLRVTETIESKYHRTRLQGGEVLLTLVGTVGESAIVPETMAAWNVARAVAVLPINGDVAASWVNLCLRSRPLQHYMRIWCTTTVQATLNLRDVARLPIPVPPKRERERITEILGSLDDTIELNRRMNDTLEKMARALFQSWFVDFDPVHAKAAVRREHPKSTNTQVSHTALPSLAPEIAELFPDRFEQSTLGPVPAAWIVSRIDEVATINSRTLGKNDPLEVIDYIEISEVMRGDIGNIPRYVRGEEPSRARRRLRHGDTILSTVRPDRGAFFLCLNPSESLIASTGFAVISPTIVPWSWLICALTRPEVFEYLGQHADGGAYPAINPALIGAIEYAVPRDTQLLQFFQDVSSEYFVRAATNRREAKVLAITRDALLPKLLSGGLRVPNPNRRP